MNEGGKPPSPQQKEKKMKALIKKASDAYWYEIKEIESFYVDEKS